MKSSIADAEAENARLFKEYQNLFLKYNGVPKRAEVPKDDDRIRKIIQKSRNAKTDIDQVAKKTATKNKNLRDENVGYTGRSLV